MPTMAVIGLVLLPSSTPDSSRRDGSTCDGGAGWPFTGARRNTPSSPCTSCASGRLVILIRPRFRILFGASPAPMAVMVPSGEMVSAAWSGTSITPP